MPNRSYLIILTVIVAGLILRLYKIDQPILEYFPERQTQTAEITRNIYFNGWPDFWISKIRYEKGFPSPLVLELPVYNLIIAGLWNFFGPVVSFGRLVSLLAYVVSSVFFAMIIVKYSGKKILFPSLLMFVLSPLHVLVSRSFQPDELAFMFLLMSVYYSSFSYLMISGFIKLPFYIFGLVSLFKSRGLKALSFTKYIIFFIPIGIWSIRASVIMKGYGYEANYSILNWFFPLFFVDYQFYVSVFNILHINALTTLGLLLLLVGIIKTWKDKRMDIWKKWLFVSALYIALFNRHVSTHEYYSLPIIPPLAAFTGAGVAEVFKSFHFKSVNSKRAFVFLITLLLTFALISPATSRISGFSLDDVNPVLIERYNKLF